MKIKVGPIAAEILHNFKGATNTEARGCVYQQARCEKPIKR